MKLLYLISKPAGGNVGKCKLKIYGYLLPYLILLLFLFNQEFNAQNLFINEFMASNVSTYPDVVDAIEYPDWLEIYNDGSDPVDIGAYYLTDNLDQPTKWRIPEGVIIPANEIL